MLLVDFKEVLGRRTGADLQVGVFGQEAEVGDGVDLGLAVARLVEQRLGKM